MAEFARMRISSTALHAAIATIALALFAGPLLAREPFAGKAKEPYETRTYDVRDLVEFVVRRQSGSDAVPPTRLLAALEARQERWEKRNRYYDGPCFPTGEEVAERARRDRTRFVEELVRTIQLIVDSRTWADADGRGKWGRGDDIGQIVTIGEILVIKQTPANHKRIQALLDQIRARFVNTRQVTGRARWTWRRGSRAARRWPTVPGRWGWKDGPCAWRPGGHNRS
jgi:hypothetical protein